MSWKPGYRTTEHWLAWGVVLLGVVALLRGTAAVDRAAATVAPALASAAYSAARGRTKAARTQRLRRLHQLRPGPPLADQLCELFRGRPVR